MKDEEKLKKALESLKIPKMPSLSLNIPDLRSTFEPPKINFDALKDIEVVGAPAILEFLKEQAVENDKETKKQHRTNVVLAIASLLFAAWGIYLTIKDQQLTKDANEIEAKQRETFVRLEEVQATNEAYKLTIDSLIYRLEEMETSLNKFKK